MSLPIHVTAYSGYKANERPSQFTLDEQVYEAFGVLDQWYEPSATYFKVQSTEGKTYLLDTTKTPMNGRCRVPSMAMSCWPGPALGQQLSKPRTFLQSAAATALVPVDDHCLCEAKFSGAIGRPGNDAVANRLQPSEGGVFDDGFIH